MNNLINKSATSINDLKELSKQINLKLDFIGSIHKLPKVLKGKSVILIHKKGEDQGHWVGLYDNLYFDPFGIPPSDIIKKKLKNMYYNNKEIQAYNENHCGQFVIDFLKHLDKKDKHKFQLMEEFINKFYIYNKF